MLLYELLAGRHRLEFRETLHKPSPFVSRPACPSFRAAFAPLGSAPATLSDIVPFLAEFLLPIVRAYANGESFDRRWSPGGPWTTGA